jgi:dTDP-4-dehydrorhamnose 3,5-epimerase
MKFIQTEIPGVVLVEPTVFGDERGFFMETYQERQFAEAGLPTSFVQDNHSGSRQGILRGLHYQIQHPQGKLVRVIAGEIYDVAVDIRRSSPDFGKWVGVLLSAQNKAQVWVPPGFAHGFYVISEWAEVFYKATDFYAPAYERTLAWNEPRIGIHWPLVDGKQPILSPKDALGKLLSEAETYD